MKPRFLLLTSLILICITLATVVWMRELAASTGAFASPLRATLPSGARTTPLTGQVVLVIAEELNADSLALLPSVASIRRLGSTSLLQMAPNARAEDILSGAIPDLLRGASARPPETVVAAVRRLGGTTVMAAPAQWLAGQTGWLSEGFAPAASAPDPAGEIVSQTLRRLDFWLPDLAVVVLPAATAAPVGELAAGSAVSGTDAPRTGTTPARLTALDSRIGEIWHAMQQARPGNAALIATGTRDGAPVVMAGRGLAAASGTLLTPGDIALTASALLGAPLPSSAQGRIQFSMMQMPEAVQAEKQLALGLQRQALADAYLSGIGRQVTGESVESDLLVARSALTARNYESALRLSGHAVNQSDAAIQAGTAGRLSGERLLRLPILVLAGFPLFYAAIGLLAALVARSPTVTAMGLAPMRLLRPWSPATTIGVVLGAAACGAFWHQRQTEAEWPLLGQALLVGALGVLLATTAWNWWAGRGAGLAGEKRDQGVAAPVSVALGAYSLCLVFASLLLPVWIYYLQGPVVTWYLPDPEPLAVLHESLGRAFMAAALSVPVPWAGSIVYVVTGWIWRWLQPPARSLLRRARSAVAVRLQASKNPEA